MLRKRCPMPDGIRSAFGKPFRSLRLHHPSGRVFVRTASSSVSSGTCAVSVGGTVRRAVPAVISAPDLPSYRFSPLCLGCVCTCLPVSVSCLCLSSLSPPVSLPSCGVFVPASVPAFPFLSRFLTFATFILLFLNLALFLLLLLLLLLLLSSSPPSVLIRRGFVLREVSRNKSSFVGMVHSATGTPAAVPLYSPRE